MEPLQPLSKVQPEIGHFSSINTAREVKTMSANNNEKLASEGRRLLIKSLAAGGATVAFLPEKWTKPVIDRILVPAHAQGSLGSLYGIYTNEGNRFGSNDQPHGLFERLANMLIPAAHAAPLNVSCNSLCIAFDVRANNSVIGYVVGSTGTGGIDPKTGMISPNPFVVAPSSFRLLNCIANGNILTGYIAPPLNASSVACLAGMFTLTKEASIPNACSYMSTPV
jgi:hypothetical protein